MGKVDTSDDFAFLQRKSKKNEDTIWSEDIYQHIALAQLQSKKIYIFELPTFAKGKVNTDNSKFKKIVDLIFAQMTATKGIKVFGQRAVSTLFKECKQFYDIDVFERVKVDDLPQIAKNKALNAINLIKEKGNGDIKGRTIANGKMQEKCLNKEETSSPTIAVELLFMSLCIDLHEKGMWLYSTYLVHT